jgi:serine/threonine protein kinase
MNTDRLNNPSAGTTRTRPRAPLHPGGYLLTCKQVVISPETKLHYRVERLLGEGGFGQVYLARRLGRSPIVPTTVCIKISARIDGWLREAYFGQLLDGHPRAIRVFDTFPLMHRLMARRSLMNRQPTVCGSSP